MHVLEARGIYADRASEPEARRQSVVLICISGSESKISLLFLQPVALLLTDQNALHA